MSSRTSNFTSRRQERTSERFCRHPLGTDRARFGLGDSAVPLTRNPAGRQALTALGVIWRRVWLLAAALLLLISHRAPAADNPYSIVNSKHNLAFTGPGDVKSTSEGDICIFCHAPHTRQNETPLWNHQMSSAIYTPYSSSTMKATVGQPTGASRLCLSCHDGTVALGMVGNRHKIIPMRGGITTMPAGTSRLGTDLTGHHPVSFTYDTALATADGELRDPNTLQQQVRLDQNQQVQCTACHDPHNNQYGTFLVMDNTASTLCLQCHLPGQWTTSAHATSQATWNGSGRNPWPHTKGTTVAANGCENCHAPHAAGTRTHLLNFAKAEDNCLVCHNGSVASKNLTTEFNKTSAHPMNGVRYMRDTSNGPLQATDTHVSCVDCHDPHATRTGTSTPGVASGALAQVAGVSSAGTRVKVASHEYELCFRCHANSSAVGNSQVPRQYTQPNTRLQFNPANASYHPVLSTAKSAQDRTLVSPWTPARQMLCSDCHNNDQGPGARGTGPNGPHGSRYAPLLERNLVQTDFQPESAAAYALCYKCHSQGVLMGDRLHSKHVREQKTSCSTCHDAHGVQMQNHLINFNTVYVKPLNGQMLYQDRGAGHSSCTLTCHGSTHNNKSY